MTRLINIQYIVVVLHCTLATSLKTICMKNVLLFPQLVNAIEIFMLAIEMNLFESVDVQMTKDK